MATTNALIEPAVRKPRLSTWMKLKRWCLDIVEESPLLQTLCCLDVDEMECYRVDQRVRSAMRDEMREHMGYSGQECCVKAVMNDVFTNTGYDLTDRGSIARANIGVKRTAKEWDAYFAKLGVDPLSLRPELNVSARIVPKFAAACALRMRCKLGSLQANEANVLLVQRKYLELCRQRNVRDVDAVLHQQFVINAVFTEGVLDEVATVRRRLPKWISWLDSLEKPGGISPTVC
nr:hypothetical protein [Tolivirales sp.]